MAAVAAETEEIAAEAVRLIDVRYEDLPAVHSPERALEPGAPVIHDEHPDNIPLTYDYAHGDVERGETESDIVIEDHFTLHYVTHCCLGVSGVLASFGPTGNLTVYSQTQVPYMYKKDISPVIDVPPEKIRVIQPAITPLTPVIHDEHPDNIPLTYDYAHGDVERGETESDIVIEDHFTLH